MKQQPVTLDSWANLLTVATVRHLNKIVNNLFAIARLEAGEARPVSLSSHFANTP
jgi:hypothetical protein